MLTWRKELAGKGEDFAFETTLSSRRVAARVRRGGQHIEPEVVERRYRRGISNFFALYLSLAHRWTVYDTSSDALAGVADGAGESVERIYSAEQWRQFRDCIR